MPVANTEAQTVVGASMATAQSVTNLNTLMGIPTNGVVVTKVTVAVPSAATSNATFFFYDWFAGNQTNLWSTNSIRFTNATVIDPFTNSVVFTNSLGRQDTNQYIGRGVFYTNATVTNTTSSVPAIGAITVSPGTTYVLDVNWILAQGLAVRGTNNNPLSFITIEYR
jgi:hypothetical protein